MCIRQEESIGGQEFITVDGEFNEGGWNLRLGEIEATD